MEVTLRTWQLNDASNLVKLANNLNIARWMTNQFPNPYNLDLAIQFIKMATADNPVHIFAIEANGQLAGGIGIHPQQDVYCRNAELGYWLGEPFWQKGIITKAIPIAVKWAFSHYPVTRIFARPFGSNVASQKALEKCGFILEARLHGTIYKNEMTEDELIYAIRL